MRQANHSLYSLCSALSVAGTPLVVHAHSDAEVIALSYSTPIWVVVGALIFLIILLLAYKRLNRELRRHQIALRKSKRHIKLMGDTLPNVIIFQLSHTAEHGFDFRYLSNGVEKTLNISRELLLKDAGRALDFIYEEDVSILVEAHDKTSQNLTAETLEIRILDQAGKLHWLHLSAVPHCEKGQLIWDGIVQDISASKNIENALTEDKHNLEHLFDTIDDFLLVCDMNGKLLHSNPAVERNLMRPASELANTSLFELYSETHRSEVFEVIARMQSEAHSTCNLPLQDKQGRSILVEMNLFQGLWKEQHVVFCVARDVASRKQTENALRESQRMLQLIMDTIPMSVFWVDKDSVYLGCNKTFIAECGLRDPSEVIGKNPTDLFNPNRADKLIQSDQHVLNTNRPLFNKMHSHSRPDGNVGWRETSRIPLQDEDGNAVGVLGVWRDVTEQHHAEDRLKHTLEDLERFNQLMRGRERRTLQLKAEINTLLKELGQPPKYRTTVEGTE